MKAYYRKHLLIVLNTAVFLAVGLALALLYTEAIYALIAALSGTGLGWLGEYLFRVFGLPVRLKLRGTLRNSRLPGINAGNDLLLGPGPAS